MYDLDKAFNLARYAVMTEHVDCLIDFSKSASCEVIVRNPFVDAPATATTKIEATKEVEEDVRNRSPVALAAHRLPVIITSGSTPRQSDPTTASNTTASAPVRPPRATCNFCGKSFGHLGDYNKHRRRHTGERPYVCDSCPRRFAHTSNLQRHRRLHSGEKPFECLTCTKSFSRKDKLAAHVARRCCKPSSV